MRQKALRYIVLPLLLIAFGMCCFFALRPWLIRTKSQIVAQSTVNSFLEEHRASKEDATVEANELQESTAEQKELPHKELLEAMQDYNQKIFEEEQNGFCSPQAYVAPALNFSAYGLDADSAIGVLQIPSISVNLPIYSGASSSHLAKGAALLTQTSFPIGGRNTNAVIGAHRGRNAEDFLRHIEDVQIGDEVIVTNFWEDLYYTVAEYKIIEPNDIAQVLIKPDRDLLTVFSCHPYSGGSKYRYLLICERVESKAQVQGG